MPGLKGRYLRAKFVDSSHDFDKVKEKTSLLFEPNLSDYASMGLCMEESLVTLEHMQTHYLHLDLIHHHIHPCQTVEQSVVQE